MRKSGSSRKLPALSHERISLHAKHNEQVRLRNVCLRLYQRLGGNITRHNIWNRLRTDLGLVCDERQARRWESKDFEDIDFQHFIQLMGECFSSHRLQRALETRPIAHELRTAITAPDLTLLSQAQASSSADSYEYQGGELASQDAENCSSLYDDDLIQTGILQLQRRARQAAGHSLAQRFSTNVAFMTRLARNDNSAKRHQSVYDENRVLVETTKSRHRMQSAHNRAVQWEKLDFMAQTRRRKEQETQEMMRKSDLNRQERLRRLHHQTFHLSPSSSTLLCSAKKNSETRKHHRSMQLLEYACEKQTALIQSRQPVAVSALVNVNVDTESLPAKRQEQLMTDELWMQFLEQQMNESPERLAKMTFSNTAPAALRFYGRH